MAEKIIIFILAFLAIINISNNQDHFLTYSHDQDVEIKVYDAIGLFSSNGLFQTNLSLCVDDAQYLNGELLREKVFSYHYICKRRGFKLLGNTEKLKEFFS